MRLHSDPYDWFTRIKLRGKAEGLKGEKQKLCCRNKNHSAWRMFKVGKSSGLEREE